MCVCAVLMCVCAVLMCVCVCTERCPSEITGSGRALVHSSRIAHA